MTNNTQQTSTHAPQDPNWTPHQERERWHLYDLFLIAYIPFIALIAWCLPERSWSPVCHGLLRFLMTLRRSRTRGQCQKLVEILGDRRSTLNAKEILENYLAKNHLARVQGMRCYIQRGWSPRIRLKGKEHIERALAGGKGAVLWVALMASRDLIIQMTHHHAGYRIVHLSRFDHGFSISRWGARWFNPIWTRIENRYLAERLVMSPTEQIKPLRQLIKRLRDNRLVTVTANHEGIKYPHILPFLNGTIQLAEGAPALALTTGAALLPVFIVHEPDGTYVTTVEPSLLPDPGTADPARSIESQIEQFVKLLESYVLRYPNDYQGWGLSGV